MSKDFKSASRLFTPWRESVESGEPPVMYPVANESNSLSQIEIGPGLVTLIGGAPGAGKTAFAMQLAVDAMRLTDTLRVLVCNVEMPADALFDRQLARISGIDLQTIRYRRFDVEHQDRLDFGFSVIDQISDRLAFVNPPFNMAGIQRAATQFDADLTVLDYIQRISPAGEYGDRRGRVDANMVSVRQLASSGMAVMVIAAVSRTRDSRGRSSYAAEGLGLASFRESSELEYGTDDAYILAPSSLYEGVVDLRHEKSRHSRRIDHRLEFDGALQRFNPVDEEVFEHRPDDEPEYSADREEGEITVSQTTPRIDWRGQLCNV